MGYIGILGACYLDLVFGHRLLRIQSIIYLQVPEAMRRNNYQELVLDTLPQLASLTINFLYAQLYGATEGVSDDDYDGIIRNITLELPSLRKLLLWRALTVKTCTLVCPKLVDVEFLFCQRMTTLNFDGGAQLKWFLSK